MGKIKSVRSDIVRTPEGKLLMRSARDPRVRYLLAMLIAYGKRISEIMCLRREDFTITEETINVRFKILKVKPKSGIMKIRSKKLSKNHWTARFILEHLETVQDGYVLPSYGRTGHITPRMARIWLKAIDPDIWPHLFRHSLATMMAEHGATAIELRRFFDWESITQALAYVQDSPQLEAKWTNRNF